MSSEDFSMSALLSLSIWKDGARLAVWAGTGSGHNGLPISILKKSRLGLGSGGEGRGGRNQRGNSKDLDSSFPTSSRGWRGEIGSGHFCCFSWGWLGHGEPVSQSIFCRNQQPCCH